MAKSKPTGMSDAIELAHGESNLYMVRSFFLLGENLYMILENFIGKQRERERERERFYQGLVKVGGRS